MDGNEKERAEELESKIREHSGRYFSGRKPGLKDGAFDALVEELKEIDPDNPVLSEVGASPPSSGWPKFTHRWTLGSLDKATERSEFEAWAVPLPSSEFFWSEKLDGISLALYYREGELEAAATRGDGTEGEEITPNAVLMDGVPRETRTEFSGMVRGEVVLPVRIWERELDGYANPRNAAAGIARLEDRGEASELVPNLRFYAYDVRTDNPPHDDASEMFLVLDGMGFRTPNHGLLKREEIHDLRDRYEETVRSDLNYEIDGLVVRIPGRRAFRRMGATDGRPDGAVAYKFENKGGITTMRDVRWEVGNTGRVTPVAVFDPVSIVGAEITKASLYNASYVSDLGLGPSDEVYVERANDVIPRVEDVVDDAGEGEFEPPSRCPSCDAELVEDGEYIVCPDAEGCPSQTLGDLQRWVEANNLLDWGDAVLSASLEAGLVSDIPDLYDLEVDDLADLQMDGRTLGEKTARKLIARLENNDNPSPSTFLAGLNIPDLREKTAASVVDHVDAEDGRTTIGRVMRMDETDLRRIDGIGPSKSESISEGLDRKAPVMSELLDCVEPEKKGGTLEGTTFCITGRLSETRAAVEADIEAAGGRMTGVTRDLDYLVTNDPDSSSSKAEKAREYGVTFIDENTLYEMIEG